MFRTPRPTKIVRIVDEAERVKTFYLQDAKVARSSKAGQFVLVWVPFPANKLSNTKIDLDPHDFELLDQIPMSISCADPANETFGITVKETGETTSELHKYPVGQNLGIIGPLGHPFSYKADTCILVGGGIGVAPLRFLASELAARRRKLIGIMGFRTKGEMLFVKEMKKMFDELIVTTDDGSYGKKGSATSCFGKYLGEHRDQGLGRDPGIMVYSCGPELMIKGVLNLCEQFKLRAEVSLERYIHCGIGICGFCSINGYRVCKDGPVFPSAKLGNIKDLGLFRRTSSGKKESI